MSKWQWLASAATAILGVLAFLRVAANEIESVEREGERRRKLEADRRRKEPAEDEAEIDAARAA